MTAVHLVNPQTAGADPGFPTGWGANHPGEAPIYECAKISEKLHEIEKISAVGGGGGGASCSP